MTASDDHTQHVLIYTTWPSQEDATRCARYLLKARQIACANILPAGKSLYVWEDSVQEDIEQVMLLKTVRLHVDAIQSIVDELHPYELPAFLVLNASPSTAFGQWITDETIVSEMEAGGASD